MAAGHPQGRPSRGPLPSASRAIGFRRVLSSPRVLVSFGVKGAIMTRLFALAVTVLAAASGEVFAQDLAAGEQSFRKCLPCHAVGPDAKNKVGPVLNGLAGRKSGTIEGYSYTEANKNSGITWDESSFKEYITDPRARIPGTKMVFAGIKNEKEKTDLWAFLSQFQANGSKK
jgi:cytochrome c